MGQQSIGHTSRDSAGWRLSTITSQPLVVVVVAAAVAVVVVVVDRPLNEPTIISSKGSPQSSASPSSQARAVRRSATHTGPR